MKKFNKTFLLLSLVVAVILCFAFSAGAVQFSETGQCGENVYWTYNENERTLTISGTGPMYDYEEDSYFDGDVFQDCTTSPFFFATNINSIVIEEGVTTVGARAFWLRHSNVESITLPDGLISINGEAFLYSEITDIIIPDSVTTIGENAFYGCSNLETVKIPSGVKSIGHGAFAYSGVFDVDEGNEYYSNDSEGALFNKDKTEIISYPQLKPNESYTIPDSVKTIGEGAFSGSETLKNISIPDSVSVIENMAFSDCYDLEEVFLPESVTYIGDYVFQDCFELINICFPKSVEHIGKALFLNCSELVNIVVDPDNQYYTSDSTGVLFDKNKTVLMEYPKNNSEKTYVIPDGVETISEYAFYWSENIETVIIPASVKTIGKSAFYATSTHLKKFFYKGTKEQFAEIEIGEGNTYLTDKRYADYISYDYNPEKLGRTEYINVTTRSTQVKLDWKRVPDAYGYRIYMKTENGWKALWDTTCNYYTEGNLKPFTEYTFAVRAGQKIDGKTVLADSYTVVTCRTTPAAPENVTIIPEDRAVTLTWTPCEGATGYRVYKEVAHSGSWITTTYEWVVVVSSVTTNSCRISNLEYGQREKYAIRPYIKNGDEVTWCEYTTVYASSKAGVVSKITSAQNTSAIRLNWDSVRATGYRIYYKSGNKWKVAVSEAKGLSHTFTGLKPGTKYTFAIRPYTKCNGKYYWSDYTEYTTATKPDTVTAKATLPSKGKITLTWNAVNGADGYKVYYKTGNGSYKLYKTCTGVQKFTFSGLKSGTKYTFAVRAGIRTSGGNVYGGYNPVTVTVK